MASIKTIFDWCKRHVILVTVLVVVCVVTFGFVNIQILHMTSEPEFCHMCHPAQGTGPLAEVDSWEHSAHADAGVSCLDCHGRPGFVGYMKAKLGGLKDTYMQLTISKEEKLEILSNPGEDLVPDYHCLFCHSDEGNQEYREKHKVSLNLLKMRMLDDVKNPEFRVRKGLPDIMEDSFVGGTRFDHSFHIESFEFSCRDCHFGLVHNPSTKTDRMNMCITCHAEYEGSAAPQLTDCQQCHQAQYAINEGEGAKGIEGEPSLMYGVGIGCVDCHTGVEKGIFRPSSSTCNDCHDPSYKEIFDDWAAATDAEVSALKELRITVEDALKEADAKQRDTADIWARYQKALYNLKLVRHDGTHGVHNRDYVEEILDTVRNDFESIQHDLDQSW